MFLSPTETRHQAELDRVKTQAAQKNKIMDSLVEQMSQVTTERDGIKQDNDTLIASIAQARQVKSPESP